MIKSDSSEYQREILDRLEHQGYIINEALIKDGLQSLVQTLMDIEVSQILDASRYERSTARRAYRNGYRATVWNTPIGEIKLRIPKLRRGTYYPERLLNDDDVADELIRLIKIMVVYGIDEATLADSLSRLNLFPLSAYELHRICDALDNVDNSSHVAVSGVLSGQPLPLHHRKYLRLIHKREMNNHHEIHQLDKEFWRDFTRRMSQAGLIVENQPSTLSSINPYARLDVDDIQSVFQTNCIQHIHTRYKDQLIA